MSDCPPCPHCGRLPSPRNAVQCWDVRELPTAYGDPGPESVSILTFCSKTCANAFWTAAAVKMHEERQGDIG